MLTATSGSATIGCEETCEVGQLGRPHWMYDKTPMYVGVNGLGVDSEIAGVIRVQNAINSAAKALGMSTGPAGGAFVQQNFDLMIAIARKYFDSVPGRAPAIKVAIKDKFPDLADKIDATMTNVVQMNFDAANTAIDDTAVANDIGEAYEVIAQVAKKPIFTPRNIAIGAGIAGVLVIGSMLLARR